MSASNERSRVLPMGPGEGVQGGLLDGPLLTARKPRLVSERGRFGDLTGSTSHATFGLDLATILTIVIEALVVKFKRVHLLVRLTYLTVDF